MQGIVSFRKLPLASALAAVFAIGLVASDGASAAIYFETQWSIPAKEGSFLDDMDTGRDGSLYVLHTGRRKATITGFGPTGENLGSWKAGSGLGNAMATDPDGNVLVASGERVERFGPAGERLKTWSFKGKIKPGLFSGFSLHAMAVAPSGQVYIVDELNGRVIRLSAAGKVLGTFGRLGADRFDLYLPSDIAVGADGRVYIAEVVESHLQVFSPGGKFLGRIGREGSAPGKFQAASIVTTDPLGRLIVGDQILQRVQILDADGEYIDQRGSQGGAPGRFTFMGQMAAGDAGELYVADRRGTRIQKFRLDSEPHIPQAQLSFGIDNFIASARPGKRVTVKFSVLNFGDRPTDDARVCPDRDHEFTAKIFGRTKCEFLEPIEPGETVKFDFTAKIPRNEERDKLHIIKFILRSGNAGGGPFGGLLFTDRRFDWLDSFSMRQAERLGADDQSVAIRLRARGAPGT